jgi:SagB-type dehydrogenase family enzyme
MYGHFARLVHAMLREAHKSMRIPQDRSQWPPAWKKIEYKTYDRLPQITLPKPRTLTNPLSVVLDKRESRRAFSSQPLSLSDLSTILFYSAGENTNGELSRPKRRYPSAGARYPLEIYLAAQNVENMEAGLYHYNVHNHALELLTNETTGGDIAEILNASKSYQFVHSAATTIIVSAVWERNFMKYRDYGYRLTLLEAGHLMQNFQLSSEACGLAYCSYVGKHDTEIDEALDIGDDRGENTLYIISIGNPLKQDEDNQNRARLG